MQSIIVVVLGMVGILVLLPTLGFGDALWNQAVKIAESNSSIYPGKIVEHERVYDTKDKLQEYTRSEYTLRIDSEKGLQLQLVKAQKDNKDITAEKAKEPLNPTDIVTEEDNPFDPLVQKQVTSRRTETTTQDGRQVAVYQYTQKTQEAMWSGKAFLDADTAVPVKIEAATDATIKEGKMKLSNMKMVVLYKTRPDGSWVQDKSILTMDINLTLMPLMTFKGKVKTETELSDYRQ